MNSVGRIGRALATIVLAALIAALIAGGGFAQATLAVGPDKAEVVLVLDFSASILNDAANRNRFAGAIERIADRVDETARDLIAGDTTMTIVRFASRAADYEGCTDMALLGSPATVRKLADCLRDVAGAYRAGIQPALTEQIGIDTNYVAAMEQAATHLPADAVRPTMILFSDGRHDVAGVPVSEVAPARDRLFGNREPFALLPVGMGLDPAARDELEAGLAGLRTIRDMPPCATGTAFEWPEVVFESPDDAGSAVAVALQNATCTFTVAPTAAPTAPPEAAVQGIGLKALDSRIEVTWSAPARVTEEIVDYRVRCAAEGEDPIESTEGVSLERQTTVEGLTNGTEYRCEVAVVGASSEGEWTPADSTATPAERPAPPGKPAVVPLNGAVRISVAPADVQGSATSAYRFECSPDNGATWPATADVSAPSDPTAQIPGLKNGVDHVCRAFAANDSGMSDASPLSDVVRPCSTFLECNALAVPLLGAVAAAIAGLVLLGLFVLARSGGGGYVVAVVDVVHSANLGHGSRFGIAFVREPHSKQVDGITAAGRRKSEVRVRKLRGDRFRVRDRRGVRVAESGESLVVEDSMGVRHDLVLWAFAGKAASAASARR
jgi:hypothetical protein